jgi:hypothetical protein
MKLSWRYHARMIGKIVIEVDQRGCMAENHVLKRMGEIVEIGDQRVFLDSPTAQSIIVARCRTLSSRELIEDEFFLVPIADGGFQPSISPLAFWWRH